MEATPAIRVEQVSFDHPDSASLRAAQRAEIEQRYSDPNSEPGPAPTAADITVFFVAYVGDEPAGCGGMRERSPSEAEIKRMYVAPAHRGTGVSTAVLNALENDGRARGYDRLVLETGTGQPDAVRFYEREGYTSIPRFGYYVDSPLSLCYEKRLSSGT